jgi:ABC-type transporter Mla maintaining outer membrane lipid asymmetry permease subunit MlaE
VLKWLLTLLVALVVLTALSPWLARFGIGRLPGDVTLRVKGRDVYLPFTTTILLSARPDAAVAAALSPLRAARACRARLA